MNRVRVISIDTSIDDERLARLLNASCTARYNECNAFVDSVNEQIEERNVGGLSLVSMERARDSYKDDARVLGHVAAGINAPRNDTYAMMEVSTCHITADDSDILEYMCECNTSGPVTGTHDLSPLSVGNFGYGFGIMLVVDPVSDPDPNLEEMERVCERQGSNFSSAFWNILRTAKAGGYRCVYIDRDVEAHEDLETFNW